MKSVTFPDPLRARGAEVDGGDTNPRVDEERVLLPGVRHFDHLLQA